MLQDWASLLLRWLHIITAIAWIGSSFYFMWLDASLRKAENMPKGAHGESWSVHGGGFYHVQKYLVAPERMPADLHWFKWESYMTWISGFSLLMVSYYLSAKSFLIDRAVLDLAPWQAISISVASLVVGWIVYDLLCKSKLKDNQAAMFAALFAFILLSGWFFNSVFSARAAFLHIGAMIATMMTANVAMVIIPNQKIVVADLMAGRTPDPKYGKIAKLRSTHNNYLTLPVVFMMMSNHYPMTFGHKYNLVIVALVLVIGAVVRHFYNMHNAGETGAAIKWQWPTAAALTAAMIAFSMWRPGGAGAVETPTAAQAAQLVQKHCVACHAVKPTNEAFSEPPKGVTFETLDQIRSHAPGINAQAVMTETMPLGNETGMTRAERDALGAWIRAGTPD